MSKRGDNLSSSDVIAASGEAMEEGVGAAGAAVKVLEHRLWKVPSLQRRNDACFIFDGRRHVNARRVIIEMAWLRRMIDKGERLIVVWDSLRFTLGPPFRVPSFQ